MCKESKLVVPLCFHFSAYRVGYNKNTINPCVLVSVNAHLLALSCTSYDAQKDIQPSKSKEK